MGIKLGGGKKLRLFMVKLSLEIT